MSSVLEHTTIDRPFVVLEAILTDAPISWLEPFLRLAYAEGERAGHALALQLHGAAPERPEGARAIEVTAEGAPVYDDDRIDMKLRWRATGYVWVPEQFKGALSVRAAGDGETFIAVEGEWGRAPGAPELAGRVCVNRAAETTIRRLLATVRTAVEHIETATG